MVFDFTLLPSRSQWPRLRDSHPLDPWEFLLQPEFAHGFLKWGAQVGYSPSWKVLWLEGLGNALTNRTRLKQLDWQSSAMRARQAQNLQRSLILKKFATKIQSAFPIEAQVQLAMETLTHTSDHLVSIDQKHSNIPNETKTKGSKPLKIRNLVHLGKHATVKGGPELHPPISSPGPWSPVLALSKTWAQHTFSKGLSTRDVERMARDLSRLSMKWDPDFLDEIIEALRSKPSEIPPCKPWLAEELTLLQLGFSLGAPPRGKQPNPPKTAKPKTSQDLDPAARIQLAEMAAGAGHEINNPLAILAGTIQKLQKEWAKPAEASTATKSVAALDLMLRQVQRVRTQIEELMWFSRPPEPNPIAIKLTDLKQIWNEKVTGESLEAPLSLPGSKNGNLVLDPIHFGRVARLIGEFVRQHIPGSESFKTIFSLKKTGKTLVGKISGPFPNWTPSQILGLFTPFFCPKGFGRSSGLHLPAARALAEKSGWNLSFVQGTKKTPGNLLLEIPLVTAEQTGSIQKKLTKFQRLPQGQEKIRFRPVA